MSPPSPLPGIPSFFCCASPHCWFPTSYSDISHLSPPYHIWPTISQQSPKGIITQTELKGTILTTPLPPATTKILLFCVVQCYAALSAKVSKGCYLLELLAFTLKCIANIGKLMPISNWSIAFNINVQTYVDLLNSNLWSVLLPLDGWCSTKKRGIGHNPLIGDFPSVWEFPEDVAGSYASLLAAPGTGSTLGRDGHAGCTYHSSYLQLADGSLGIIASWWDCSNMFWGCSRLPDGFSTLLSQAEKLHSRECGPKGPWRL